MSDTKTQKPTVRNNHKYEKQQDIFFSEKHGSTNDTLKYHKIIEVILYLELTN